MKIDNQFFIENTYIINVSVFYWQKQWVNQGLAFVPKLHLITPILLNHSAKLNLRLAILLTISFLIPWRTSSQMHSGGTGPFTFIRYWVYLSYF
jgi:hypothetical protein